jgi:hypothetical protein
MSGTTKRSPKPKRKDVSQDDCVAWAVGKGFTVEKDGDWCWLTNDGLTDTQENELRDYGFRKKGSGYRKLKSGRKGYWGHSCKAPTRIKRFTKGKGKSKPTPVVTTAATEEGESLMETLKRQLEEAKA